MTEIPFRAKESASLAPACLERTTGMLFLNPQFRAHLHLWRGFTFSISLLWQGKHFPNGELYFPWGVHRQTIEVSFVPCKRQGVPGATGEQPPLLWYLQATLPSSKWSCGRDPACALLVLPFWCFSSFMGSPWKYTMTGISVALLFRSCSQNHQHIDN